MTMSRHHSTIAGKLGPDPNSYAITSQLEEYRIDAGVAHRAREYRRSHPGWATNMVFRLKLLFRTRFGNRSRSTPCRTPRRRSRWLPVRRS